MTTFSVSKDNIIYNMSVLSEYVGDKLSIIRVIWKVSEA